jgi:uncharacterized protein (TIGR02231 family)
MAGGVSWAPIYEARADEAHKQVHLAVLAHVIQATGEAWKDVKVTLSTAITRRNATPPEPQRLYLGATREEDRRRVLVRRYEQVSHVDSLDKSEASCAGAVAMAAEDQGLSVQLEARRPADFPGDGRPMRLEIETLDLPATYSLVIVPKVIPYAFRAAKMKNQARYPLLPGRVDLFSGGSYLGQSMLERTAQGDEIDLAFGIEEPVKVRRVVLDEEQKDPSFLGSTRRLLYAYRIELASFESKPTEVTVQEHVPVSQLDDVKVVIDEKTTAGYELARDDGIVTWKVKLAPKEKKDLELRFRVEIPEKYDSSGL